MTLKRKHRTLKQVKEMAGFIKNTFNAKNVILFGSYAYGNPNEHSDVDIMVIVNTKQKNHIKAGEIKIALNHKFGFPFPVDLLVRSPKEVENTYKTNSFLSEVMSMGKNL